MERGIGARFQRLTRYGAFPWTDMPRQSLTASSAVPLMTVTGPSLPLGEAIGRRRSIRRFSNTPLSFEHVSFLLWAMNGLRDRQGHRTVPSAGACYSLDVTLIANRVEGLEAGMYDHDPVGMRLVARRPGQWGRQTADACLGQDMGALAGAVFVMSAEFARTTERYGDRGYRYVYLDAGHMGQNLLLAATALGLGACPIGAFSDDMFNELLQLDGDAQGVLYLVAVGTIE